MKKGLVKALSCGVMALVACTLVVGCGAKTAAFTAQTQEVSITTNTNVKFSNHQNFKLENKGLKPAAGENAAYTLFVASGESNAFSEAQAEEYWTGAGLTGTHYAVLQQNFASGSVVTVAWVSDADKAKALTSGTTYTVASGTAVSESNEILPKENWVLGFRDAISATPYWRVEVKASATATTTVNYVLDFSHFLSVAAE